MSPTLLDKLTDTASAIDPRAQEIYDVYRRTSDIYRRTTAAMGRTPKAMVTMANTQTVQLNERRNRS